MQVLKRRSVAWCVLAVVVLLSLSLSGGGALRDYRNETLDIFTLGINDDGLSIENDLAVRAETATALATEAGNSGIDEALVSAVRQAAADLSAATGISAKYRANAALDEAVDALAAQIKTASISQAEKETLGRYSAELRSRADTIRRDVYNEKAAQFNDSLSAFPASFIAMISGVGPVELFQ